MGCGLNQFPTVVPFLLKEILQPFKPSPACVMDKTLTCLVAFDNRFLVALGLWEFMQRDLIFPLGHRLSFLEVSYGRTRNNPKDLHPWDEDLLTSRRIYFNVTVYLSTRW